MIKQLKQHMFMSLEKTHMMKRTIHIHTLVQLVVMKKRMKRCNNVLYNEYLQQYKLSEPNFFMLKYPIFLENLRKNIIAREYYIMNDLILYINRIYLNLVYNSLVFSLIIIVYEIFLL